MRTTILSIAVLLVGLVNPLRAEEVLFDNGLYLGVDVKASFISRDKKINYGLWSPTVPIKPTEIKAVAPSPSILLGYKFTSNDSVSLRGEWARYSVGRNPINNGNKGDGTCNGLGAPLINGQSPFAGRPNDGNCDAPAGVDIDWKSDVVNGELEYQRLLWTNKLAGVLALLGFQYRFEGQQFDAEGRYLPGSLGAPARSDILSEKLNEHLFGPYAGFKTSFKPWLDSRLSGVIKGRGGFLFKSASFRGRQNFDPDGVIGDGPIHVSQNDHASNGTPFASADLDIIYSLTKNLHLGLGYTFEWIAAAAHISNPKIGLTKAKITDATVLTHRTGINLIYNFD